MLMVADQLISRIEFLHMKGFVHRDIKPNNFMTGCGEKHKTIYLIDFGLAKRYKDFKTNEHILPKTGKSLVGTARYASIASHNGIGHFVELVRTRSSGRSRVDWILVGVPSKGTSSLARTEVKMQGGEVRCHRIDQKEDTP